LKFIINKSNKINFKQGLISFFEYSDLGVDIATNVDYGANIIRAVAGKYPVVQWHYLELNFHMVYIIEGWVKFEYEN
jgi:hypothetical protein